MILLVEEVNSKIVFDNLIEKLKTMTEDQFDKYSNNKWEYSIELRSPNVGDLIDYALSSADKKDLMTRFVDWVQSDSGNVISEFVNDWVNEYPDQEIDYDELISAVIDEWVINSDIDDYNGYNQFIEDLESTLY